MHLSALDTNVCKTESRPSTEPNPSVSVAVARVGHGDLDVLQLGALGDTPPKCREGISWTGQ